MKKTFFVGDDRKHKVDVDFSITGKERIYVDDILVHDDRNFSRKGSWNFKAGDHDVRIDVEIGFREWSCMVFVDGSLFIEELFAEEFKKRRSYLRRYYLFLIIILFLLLFFSFLKGFYQGLTGAG